MSPGGERVEQRERVDVHDQLQRSTSTFVRYPGEPGV
jgi:hypothetical protein